MDNTVVLITINIVFAHGLLKMLATGSQACGRVQGTGAGTRICQPTTGQDKPTAWPPGPAAAGGGE
jgi:hypothetical protein